MICTSNRSKDFRSRLQHFHFQLTQYFRRKWSAPASNDTKIISSIASWLFEYLCMHLMFILFFGASLKLFNIQITSRDIFIFHYFWYIPSHIHKLQFISNKLRKCSNSRSKVKNKVYLFPSRWKTNVIPTVVLPPSKWFFEYPLRWWTRINTPFVVL